MMMTGGSGGGGGGVGSGGALGMSRAEREVNSSAVITGRLDKVV